MISYYRSLIQTTQIPAAIPTFALKSNNNQLNIYFGQGASLEGSLIIDWGDGVTETFINQEFNSASHTYDKQNEDLVEINITTDLDIIIINFANNQLTEIATGELPSTLRKLELQQNLITSFNTSHPLPASLIQLYLFSNQLTSFNPSYPLPSTLQQLYLYVNQISSFYPSHPLPSSLRNLRLYSNQLTSFNPSHPLPASLIQLYLNNNLLNTDEVNTTLILLNNTYTAPGSTPNGPKTFSITMSSGSPPTGDGLIAKAELEARGYAVYTD